METSELILFGLCLWASGATYLAFMYWRRFMTSKLIIIALGVDLISIAKGEMDIQIVGDRVIRTPKEKTNA